MNNRDALRHANKKKLGNDLIKMALFAVIAMFVALAVIWYVGTVVAPDEREPVVALAIYDEETTTPTEYQPLFEDDYTVRRGEEAPDAPPAVGINHVEAGGHFELPIYGATAWAAATTPLRSGAAASASAVQSLSPGTGFTILNTHGTWWYVQLGSGTTGWVDHRATFINLPDVLPSIVYSNTNASGSVKRSLGLDIPGVTGEVLHSAWGYNPRLGRYEYIVPGMYALARSLFDVQQHALSMGDTLIINEVFRPRETQNASVQGMNRLISQNDDVRRAINDGPWSLGHFISTGVSNHQRGAAVDASLGRISEYEYVQTGDYVFRRITIFREYFMQTEIHELSPRSAIFESPRSATAAQMRTGELPMRQDVTPGTRALQYAFGVGGFTPLSSEWWHFNHPNSVAIANSVGVTGNFFTPTIYSVPPEHRS